MTPPGVDVAAYRVPPPTVVHIGPGVFHRGHQAVYADAVLRSGSPTGAVRAVSLRSSGLRDALAAQGNRYCVVERDGVAPDRARQVGSIAEILVAADGVEAALAGLTDPAVTVVTITVTEHGYCAVTPGGPLDPARPEIRHDLRLPHAPRSLPGMLVEALSRRRAAGCAPPAVVSCDNLPSNGAATRRVVCDLAEHRGGGLAAWIRAEVAFPGSMVDRMVPATTDDDRERLRAQTGVDDAWPVMTEPFTQWVLEDRFPAGRPPWERAGVQMIDDVGPYEQAKLRILNAAHSALAYHGLLAGHRQIWQAAADPALSRAVAELLTREVLPTVVPPPGWDLPGYAARVLERFANRSLPYTAAKVARDGSQKIPVRVLPTVAARLAGGAGTDRLARLVAAWITCVLGPRADQLQVRDPGLDHLLGAGRRPAPDAGAAVDRMLALAPVFPPGIAGHAGFRDQLHHHVREQWAGGRDG